ncbi:MAG: hypothetical protein B5M53_01765 [Candidatus Cloacimonas sp. 4484_209]|nr:MAG: hypothetical protein B5M53_01765 [Candidatus Cloacimonas sp. 4484_209]
MQFHYFFSAVIAFFFMKIFMGLTVEGQQNIPLKGGVIIAPNHISNWDPPIIAVSVALRREVFFLAKQELFKSNKFFALLLKKYNSFPIKRYGVDKKIIRFSSFQLKRGRPIVIFPEGKRNPKRLPIEPQSGVGYLALKNKVKVIPAYIEGTAEKMIDLIRRKKHVLVRFGKPIDTAKIVQDGSLLKRSRIVTDFIMKQIFALEKNV